MTSIELGVLVLLGISAALHFGPVATRAASWQMFAPGQFDLSSFAAGAVVALYLFWGWDVALNLNEETRDAARTPGLGAALAMAVVIAAFTAYAVLILQALPDAAIHEAGTNILFVIAEQLLPRPWSYLAVLALMLSTVGTLQTCILQFSRTLFAKARDRKLHPRWAQVHPRWRTPHRATLLVSGLGAALLVLSVFFASIDAILKASINAIGVLAAVYYGLAGMACAWHFRHLARSAPGRFVGVVLWPAGSALAMWVCAGITLRDADGLTNAVTLVGLLAAGVPLAMQRRGRYE